MEQNISVTCSLKFLKTINFRFLSISLFFTSLFDDKLNVIKIFYKLQ